MNKLCVNYTLIMLLQLVILASLNVEITDWRVLVTVFNLVVYPPSIILEARKIRRDAAGGSK